MEEVSVSVNEVAESARLAAAAAEATRAAVETGSEHMARSSDSTKYVFQAVEASGQAIAAPMASIEKIGNITQVIKEIADQTNLLALNAAIEAARAGEQERGFAERTSQSTAEITSMVSDVQKTTEEVAVSSMGHASEQVRKGQSLLETTQNQFRDIARASEEVLMTTQHIANATREQSIATADVATSMEHISQMLGGSGRTVEEVGLSNQRLDDTAGNLHKIAKNRPVAG